AEHPEDILLAVGPEYAAELVEELPTDDAADLVAELPAGDREAVLEEITDRADVERLLKYPEDSAGGLMTANVVSVREDATVAEAGKLLGRITFDDVVDVVEAETTEDILKFGGMEALDAPYLKVAFGRMVRKRAGWLAALFLGEMLTATAMAFFQEEIAKAVI